MKLQILIPSLMVTAGMPLIGLVGCSCSNNNLYSVTLESDGMLDLSSSGGKVGEDCVALITQRAGYDDGNWIIPDNKIYYEVTVDGKEFNDYEITKVLGPSGDQYDYKILFYIPKESVGKNIRIKVKPYCKFLTFTNSDSQGGIVFSNNGANVDLHYSFDLSTPKENWTTWNKNTSITLSPNQSVYVWNSDSSFSTTTTGDKTFQQTKGGNIYCSGNIMSLINFDNLTNYCFASLFFGFQNLTPTLVLPSVNLAKGCYFNMFSKTSIQEIILPAVDLELECYFQMFDHCQKIKYIKVGFGLPGSRIWQRDTTTNWLDYAKDTDDCTFVWHGSKDGPESRDHNTVLPNWQIGTW